MIFGVGLSKTGTTSLFAALDRMGYRAGTYRHLRALGVEDWRSGRFAKDFFWALLRRFEYSDLR